MWSSVLRASLASVAGRVLWLIRMPGATPTGGTSQWEVALGKDRAVAIRQDKLPIPTHDQAARFAPGMAYA